MLNFKDFGEGSALVFLHGFLESITMWNYLNLPKLERRIILIDLPGHGDSLNLDDKDPSIAYMSDKVIEVLECLNIESFSIVGHSMGGYVSLDLKNKLRNSTSLHCNKVILLNSNFWEDSDAKKKDRLRVASIVFKNKNLFIQTAIPNLFHAPNKFQNEINELLKEALTISEHSIAYAALAMRNRRDHSSLLNKYPNDFFIIQGINDNAVQAEEMRTKVKEGITIRYIDDVGHMSHIESPDVVLNEINNFLNVHLVEGTV